MAINDKLMSLVGDWIGTNRLNLSWTPDPVKESASKAVVRSRADGTCLEVEYRWEYEGQPQEGFIVLTADAPNLAQAVWTDSWHSKNVIMSCEGNTFDSGSVNLKGCYKVEGHPNWGWRMEIIPDMDNFRYLMFNVSPEGQEEWAVEMEFKRA